MKKFCESLKKHAKNISDFKKKKMLPLTKKITSECNGMLHFWKKNLKKAL